MDIHGGDVYRNKIEYDFSVSLNPLGCPEQIPEALRNAASRTGQYPDPYQEEVRGKLADCYGVNPENIVCGNGASELFAAIVRMVKPKTALLASPTFSGYEYALGMQEGCRIKRYYLSEEDDFELKADFLEEITKDIDIVFLCNPNNPTGKGIDAGLVHRILEKCMHHDIYLVMDECFLELSDKGGSMTSQIFGYDRLIVVKAFTKLFGIPGVRMGFALAEAGTTERIRGQLPEWNLSVFAEAAAVEGCRLLGKFRDQVDEDDGTSSSEFISKTREVILTEREYLVRELEALGQKVFSPDTCFILFKTDADIYEPLIRRGILIRDCSNYKGLEKGFYRVAVKDHGSNEVLINSIREILNGT